MVRVWVGGTFHPFSHLIWLLGSLKNPTFDWLRKLIVIYLSWTQTPSWGYLKSIWVKGSYLEAFWSSFGVVTQSLVLEKVEDWRKKGKISSQIFIYHKFLVKVGILALLFCFSMLIMLESCIWCWVVNFFLACVLRLIWRDLWLFLMHFYACLEVFFLRGFHGDCFGITHPWIAKKCPCMGVGL